jgi:hypothetical protein
MVVHLVALVCSCVADSCDVSNDAHTLEGRNAERTCNACNACDTSHTESRWSCHACHACHASEADDTTGTTEQARASAW